MISAIACVLEMHNDWYIGMYNDLLFDIRSDKRFFRNYIKDAILICGYNTYKTLPDYILKSNSIIVITNNHYNDFDGNIDSCINEIKTVATYDVADVYELSKDHPNHRFVVIGGGQIYNLFIDFIDIMNVTVVVNQEVYEYKELIISNATRICNFHLLKNYIMRHMFMNKMHDIDQKSKSVIQFEIRSYYKVTDPKNPSESYIDNCGELQKVQDLIDEYVK